MTIQFGCSMNSGNKEGQISQKAGQLACAIAFTILLGWLYSKRIYLTHDNYSAFEKYYDVFAYGGEFSSLGSIFNIDVLTGCLLYILFGHTLFAIVLKLLLPVLLCLFLTSYLSSRSGTKVNWLAFPLLLFILAPLEGNCGTWLYHQWETFTLLLFLVIFDKLIISKRSRKQVCIGIFLSILITLYGIFIVGSILTVVYVAVPAMAFGFLIYFQRIQQKQKFIGTLMVFGIFAFFALSVSGFFDWVYNGYGGSAYMGWTSIEHLLDNTMDSIKYTAESWGIAYGEQTLVQGRSFIYLIKYFLFFYAMFLCLRDVVCGMKDYRTVNLKVFMCSLCVICNFAANIIGTCLYSDPSRYFGGAHYALAILLCQHLSEKRYEEKSSKCNRQRSKAGITVFLCLVLLSCGMDREISKASKVSQTDYDITEYLLDHDLQYGMGDFTNIHSCSVLSHGLTEAFACYMWEGTIVPLFYIPTSYYENSCQYRYIYDTDETHWEEDAIEKFYGDYVAKKVVDKRTIYTYDYDIRWQQIMIDADGTVFYERTNSYPSYKINPSETVTYTFDLPIGTSRITLHGDDVQKLQVKITGKERGFKIVDKAHDKGQISYDISCSSLTPVEICLINPSEEQVSFGYLDLRMVYAAQDLAKDQTIGAGEEQKLSLDTTESKVRFAVKGEHADKLKLQAGENSNLTFKKIRAGDVQAIYEVSGIAEGRPNEILLKNRTDQRLSIEKISYEHTDFEKLYEKQFSYAVHRTIEKVSSRRDR